MDDGKVRMMSRDNGRKNHNPYPKVTSAIFELFSDKIDYCKECNAYEPLGKLDKCFKCTHQINK